MNDIKRWLDDPLACNSLEARVLSAGQSLTPPPGLEERSLAEFTGLVAVVAATATNAAAATPGELALLAEPGGAALGSTATTSLALGALKSLGIGVALGALGLGALQAFTPSLVPSTPRPTTSAASAASATARRAGSPSSEPQLPTEAQQAPAAAPSSIPSVGAPQNPSRSVTAPRAPSEAASSDSTAAPAAIDPPETTGSERRATASAPEASAPARLAASELKAEAQELARARNLLGEGRAGEALRVLEASARRFASGALRDERELLQVQALARLGQTEAARSRARLFLARDPKSALAPRMRRAAGLE